MNLFVNKIIENVIKLKWGYMWVGGVPNQIRLVFLWKKNVCGDREHLTAEKLELGKDC
jgi:hypothetical protein